MPLLFDLNVIYANICKIHASMSSLGLRAKWTEFHQFSNKNQTLMHEYFSPCN